MSLWASLLGSTPWVFLGVTVVLMGGCACLAGQALAGGWRPAWHIVPYGMLLGGADRFLTFALFHGDLLSASGYAIDTILLIAMGFAAHRATLARRLANQYPWIYERSGIFGWRERNPHRS